MENMIGSKVQNGTFLKTWLDGVLVAGRTGFQAKWSKQKTDVAMCGQMAVDSKTTNVKGTLSLDMFRVYTLTPEDVAAIQAGIDKRHTIIGELDDPDAFGAERLAFYNVSFDEHTLMDASAGSVSKVTLPGTFTKSEYLDKITQE